MGAVLIDSGDRRVQAGNQHETGNVVWDSKIKSVISSIKDDIYALCGPNA